MQPMMLSKFKIPLLITAIILSICLTACDQASPPKTQAQDNPDKKNTSDSTSSHDEDQHNHKNSTKDQSQAQQWPIDQATQKIQQISKHLKRDILLNDKLAAISIFKHNQLPYQDILPIKVEAITIHNAEKLHATGQWQFIDVRKDKDYQVTGTIPGSAHLEYQFEKANYTGKTQLTQDKLLKILENKKGIVFFCNGPKCPRSYNASIVSVNHWNISSEKIKWYHQGAPSWDMHLLIKAE